ncbi:hypothetical protein LguiA_027179 [Lonicera macranthoides]
MDINIFFRVFTLVALYDYRQKRVRFPKGKKIKSGDEVVDVGPHTEDSPSEVKDPHLAAKERALRRTQITAKLLEEENAGMLHDISAAEEHYEDNETFVDDGIQIEPFNLSKEREEGYFDAAGNYVEYINENDIKDAWLDNVDVGPKFAGSSTATNNEDQVADLSSRDIGKMKRRIADALEPGETVLRALRRLKGTSNNKKEKMSAETKVIFDQLTEDAMKLMENGDYNVYDEKQEVFEREAAGYERLAQARGEGTSTNSGERNSSPIANESLPNGTDAGRVVSGLVDKDLGTSNLNTSTAANDDGDFDMFAEEDENANANPAPDGGNLVPGPDPNNRSSESGPVQDDYVYDESTGYYYSSTLGYYYDPSTGMYCYAESGQWYSYNEETGNYDEIQQSNSS